MLWDVKDVLLVFHVDGNEFITNFWSMFSIVNEAELFGLNVHFELWIILKSDALAFDLLSPSILVKALSEEDNICEHNFVVELIDSIAHSVKIKSKDLVNQHFLAILGA